MGYARTKSSVEANSDKYLPPWRIYTPQFCERVSLLLRCRRRRQHCVAFRSSAQRLNLPCGANKVLQTFSNTISSLSLFYLLFLSSTLSPFLFFSLSPLLFLTTIIAFSLFFSALFLSTFSCYRKLVRLPARCGNLNNLRHATRKEAG